MISIELAENNQKIIPLPCYHESCEGYVYIFSPINHTIVKKLYYCSPSYKCHTIFNCVYRFHNAWKHRYKHYNRYFTSTGLNVRAIYSETKFDPTSNDSHLVYFMFHVAMLFSFKEFLVTTNICIHRPRIQTTNSNHSNIMTGFLLYNSRWRPAWLYANYDVM